ncbi:MAG: redoxin domain-containing protein [Bacteroidota bacterium]
MKFILRVLLPISLVVNIYYVSQHYQQYQIDQANKSMFPSKEHAREDGMIYLKKRIVDNYANLKSKKYYFINIWNLVCGPCIKEMPLLDSMVMHIDRKKIGCIFLTENGDKVVNDFLERKKHRPINFSFINDADYYISSVMSQKESQVTTYPIQLVIDLEGNIKYFASGTIESANDTTLINFMNRLP